MSFADTTPVGGIAPLPITEWTSVPPTDTSPGTRGQAAYNGIGSLYLCVETDKWIKLTDDGTGAWI